MAVHVQVALGLDGEVQQRVAGKRLEHVVEEPDAGAHARLAASVEVHPDVEVGLFGGAADLADAAHWHLAWNVILSGAKDRRSMRVTLEPHSYHPPDPSLRSG